MIGGSSKILLFVLVGHFLLCHKFCLAVNSFSRSNDFQIDINKIRVETEREPSALKTDEEIAAEDLGEIPTDEKNDVPTIVQEFNDIRVNAAHVTMIRLLTCTSEKMVQQTLNSVGSTSVIRETSDYWTGELNRYFDGNDYTATKINPIRGTLDENPTIKQQVTSSRVRLYQTAIIIMDCPEWCSQPIKIQQILKGNPGVVYQKTRLLMVCPAQSNPTVSVSQWTDKPYRSSQSYEVYVLNSTK